MDGNFIDNDLEEVHLDAGGTVLVGVLGIPADACGVVAFAHGSGSGRRSPRNLFVARALRAMRVGTLLVDLLTDVEEAIDRRTAEYRFDISLLGDRVGGVVRWLREVAPTRQLPVGLFGASTGAAAALLAAARRPGDVAAIVCRGGRCDLAGEALPLVRAPTMMIIGGADTHVVQLNQQARQRMVTRTRLVILPGAGHLFAEPGALEGVAGLAGSWFQCHLTAARAAAHA